MFSQFLSSLCPNPQGPQNHNVLTGQKHLCKGKPHKVERIQKEKIATTCQHCYSDRVSFFTTFSSSSKAS